MCMRASAAIDFTRDVQSIFDEYMWLRSACFCIVIAASKHRRAILWYRQMEMHRAQAEDAADQRHRNKCKALQKACPLS